MMTLHTHLRQAITCEDPNEVGCSFTTMDVALFNNHSCDVAANGGRCEDAPACGHEPGDCNGLLYGSDEAIKAQVHEAWATGHGYCDHAEGIYNCDDDGDDDE